MRYCAWPGCGKLVKGGYCEKHATRDRMCQYPRCPNKVTKGNYCDEHQPSKQYDRRRSKTEHRDYGSAWPKVREAYMATVFWLCERCKAEGRLTPATLVHHKVRIADGGDRYDFNNLMALCYRCHERIHSEQGDYKGNVSTTQNRTASQSRSKGDFL